MPTTELSPEATLQLWQAEEAAVRLCIGAPGVARPDRVAGKTGLEVLQAIFDGELPSPMIGVPMDMLPIRMDHGVAIFQGRPSRTHYNPLVRAEGRIIHMGRSMGTAEGRLVGPDGKLYAHASTTCFIFETPTAKG